MIFADDSDTLYIIRARAREREKGAPFCYDLPLTPPKEGRIVGDYNFFRNLLRHFYGVSHILYCVCL